MFVMESDQIARAAALAIRHGKAVLVVRQGLLDCDDFVLLRGLLSCVTGDLEEGVTSAAQPVVA